MAQQVGRNQAALQVELFEFVNLLGVVVGESLDAALAHCINGLIRAGLLGGDFAWGPSTAPDAPWPYRLEVNLTMGGMELYGWAIGRGATGPADFITLGAIEGDYDGLPLLTKSRLPRAPQLPPLATDARQ